VSVTFARGSRFDDKSNLGAVQEIVRLRMYVRVASCVYKLCSLLNTYFVRIDTHICKLVVQQDHSKLGGHQILNGNGRLVTKPSQPTDSTRDQRPISQPHPCS
jgi:hypothetical protein